MNDPTVVENRKPLTLEDAKPGRRIVAVDGETGEEHYVTLMSYAMLGPEADMEVQVARTIVGDGEFETEKKTITVTTADIGLTTQRNGRRTASAYPDNRILPQE